VALTLKKHGIYKVRPLAGGLHEWKKLGYPMSEPHAELTEISLIAAR